MKQLYEHVELSKQAHLSYINRRALEQQDEYIILNAIAGIRELHPEMGAKKMYHILKPANIGRDKFIILAMENGYRIRLQKNFQKTTYNSHIYKYRNLIKGMVINETNRIWASDITYYFLNGSYYYLTFIFDVYSRRILGSIAYTSLEARANLYALEMAFDIRGNICYEQLIHHSDRGTQYTSNVYTDALLERNIQISMCDSVYENAHIERVNGIIKNEYLRHWTIDGFSGLKVSLKKAVYLYNFKRPHLSLGYMSPVGYENYIKTIPIMKRESLHLYTSFNSAESNKYINQLELFDL